MKTLFGIGGMVLVLMAGTSYGIDFGQEITVDDRMAGYAGFSPWWSSREDNEVEPDVFWKGQIYDLEGMMFDQAAQTLTIVSGYNFWSPPDTDTMQPGDLFIDIDGQVAFGDPSSGGSGNTTEPNQWGYEFVYDIDFGANTYDVYSITDETPLRNVLYGETQIDTRGSNPWMFDIEDDTEGTATFEFDGTLQEDISYWDDLTDSDLTAYSASGAFRKENDPTWVDRHYAIQFSLAGLNLAPGTELTAHFTQQCGNDNLIGRTPPIEVPDHGMTLTLLGTALLGLQFMRRKH